MGIITASFGGIFGDEECAIGLFTLFPGFSDQTEEKGFCVFSLCGPLIC